MKRPLRILASVVFATALYGEEPQKETDRPFQMDLKALPAEDGWVGLDFRIDLEFDRKDQDAGTRWSGFFKSRGFLTADPDENDLDSLSASLGFDFNPLWRINPQPAAGVLRVTPDTIDDVSVDDFRERGAASQSPLAVYFEGLGKVESTQDFESWNVAAGGALAVTTSWLHPILDLPFKWLHDDHNQPRHLDVSVGYDYLLSREREKGPEAGQHRLALAAEYETGLGRSDRLRFTFAAHHDLGGGGSGSGEFHPFFEARYMHLLVDRPGAEVAFSIKWTTGELPPNYAEGNVLGAGFSIEF